MKTISSTSINTRSSSKNSTNVSIETTASTTCHTRQFSKETNSSISTAYHSAENSISNNNNNIDLEATEDKNQLKTKQKKKIVDNKPNASDKQNRGSNSFVFRCLWRTVHFMWQVSELPGKIGETLGTLYKYAQESVDIFLCVAGKARRKERDGDQNSTDTKLYLEESVLERKLPEADLKALVDLPAGLDYNEWLASHTLALFEHVNLVYGTISEFCTPSGCPDMTGPGNRTYLWFDEKGKKTRVAAPQYIDYVMTFTQKTVSDESIFPTKYANEFPSSFESIARKILRLQFHVIAHLYAAHFREIALLGLHTHLNLTFAHLTALHRRFNLIDEKETDVLRDLEVALRLTDDGQSTNSSAPASESGATTADSNSSCSATTAFAHTTTTTTTTTTTHYNSAQHQQQQVHVNSSSSNSSGLDDVNSMQQTQLIDGDAAAPPICTQPEAHTKTNTTPAAVFGGGGGLIGGILGDLTSGEFGDTTRYCTSAIPPSANVGNDVGVALGNCNNATLHLNFNNNHHHYHHQHHLQQQQQLQQHSGLIQCNANNAPNANTVSASAAAAAAAAAATSTAATTTTTA